jgi:hypothetical protein
MIFTTNQNTLIVQLQGAEKFWALKTRLLINKNDITCVDYKTSFSMWRKWQIRFPGTALPGVLVAGSYWTEQGWDFLYLKKPQGWVNLSVNNVLFIETKLPKYKHIIISCSPESAQKIISLAN